MYWARVTHRGKLLTGSIMITALGGVFLESTLMIDLSQLAQAAALCVVIALIILFDRRPTLEQGFGGANTTTLARGVLTALLAGLVGAFSSEQIAWLAAGIAAICLLSDGLDGWVARRTKTTSEFGARFDMEIDALLLLILAILVVSAGKAPYWIVAIGALRYAFVLAGQLLPILRAPLPESLRRKSVCVMQGIALALCLTPIVPATVSGPGLTICLACLTWSFAVDCRWLITHARTALQPEHSTA